MMSVPKSVVLLKVLYIIYGGIMTDVNYELKVSHFHALLRWSEQKLEKIVISIISPWLMVNCK